MKRLIAFDLDNTLAKIGKGIQEKDVTLLKKLEDQGADIAIVSGKPAFYLCGLLRQIELKRPILAGENGAVIQIGVELPPKERYVLPCSEEAKETVLFFRYKILQSIPEMFFQPNDVGLTPFPKNEEEFKIIQDLLGKFRPQLRDVTVYRHVDSYDFVPNGIDKKSGLRFLCKKMGGYDKVIAVGDGVNDYPMFEEADLALGVRVKDEEKVDRNFDTITELLEYLLEE